MVTMPGKSYKGTPPPATLKDKIPGKSTLPSSAAEDKSLSDRLRGHVEHLAGKIGERNISQAYKELEAAADYVEKYLRELGYEVTLQSFEVDGKTVRNIEAMKRGKALADEIVVIGAHYDSAQDTPGANDNASGVAGMLEMARLAKDDAPTRTVRFLAFVNEEPPYFHTEDMGSLHYAKRCKEREENVVAMLSLETIGYYSDEPGSQKYPAAVRAFYPDEGNFIAFVGNTGSGGLVRRCIRRFRETTSFPSEGAILPGMITGVDWSDHWSFWEHGYDGVMITDTAIFRYPHYHGREDTPDQIDYDRTSRVVAGLVNVLRFLADEK
ncbi:MAG: M28 family peptidase [Deltaproteobacteria bacterium]|nr:M28 family peptidase [Deltaproteobacteria bacterium]